MVLKTRISSLFSQQLPWFGVESSLTIALPWFFFQNAPSSNPWSITLPPSNPPTTPAQPLSVQLLTLWLPTSISSILHLVFTLAPLVLVTLQTHNYVSGFHAFVCVLPGLFFLINSFSLMWHTKMPFCYSGALARHLVLSKRSAETTGPHQNVLDIWSSILDPVQNVHKDNSHLPNPMCYYQIATKLRRAIVGNITTTHWTNKTW